MGIITEISSQKNRKRVNIFIDGQFVSGLSFESAVKNGLKTGLEIDQNKLETIIEESETQSAFTYALDLISRSDKTKKELASKLKEKGFVEKAISKAIEKLEGYKYLDDGLYAKHFVKSNPTKSKREIEYKLKNKGVSEDLIQEALLLVEDENELENALSYARKYMRNKELNEKTKSNLFAGLARKGFTLDHIYSVVDIVKKEKQE